MPGVTLRVEHKVPTLFANVRQGWVCLTVTNALAYYSTQLTKAVKGFMIQAPCETYKH